MGWFSDALINAAWLNCKSPRRVRPRLCDKLQNWRAGTRADAISGGRMMQPPGNKRGRFGLVMNESFPILTACSETGGSYARCHPENGGPPGRSASRVGQQRSQRPAIGATYHPADHHQSVQSGDAVSHGRSTPIPGAPAGTAATRPGLALSALCLRIKPIGLLPGAGFLYDLFFEA